MKAYLDKIEFPDKFWKHVEQRIATTLGIPKKRVLVFKDLTYVRIKGKGGSTQAHSDFYFFAESTDLLARFRQAPTYSTEDGMCVICLRRPGVEFDHIVLCRNCANGYIPLFTAWISLGDYGNKTHTLLEWLPGSQDADYSHIDEESVLAKQVPKNFKIQKKHWRYTHPDGIKKCDMILFNCKTIHKAESSREYVGPRMSIDVRFAIFPNLD